MGLPSRSSPELKLVGATVMPRLVENEDPVVVEVAQRPETDTGAR